MRNAPRARTNCRSRRPSRNALLLRSLTRTSSTRSVICSRLVVEPMERSSISSFPDTRSPTVTRFAGTALQSDVASSWSRHDLNDLARWLGRSRALRRSNRGRCRLPNEVSRPTIASYLSLPSRVGQGPVLRAVVVLEARATFVQIANLRKSPRLPIPAHERHTEALQVQIFFFLFRLPVSVEHLA